MMEGEFLVEAAEYELSAIRCMLCVALWIWSVILPWIPLVSVPVVLAFILAALHFARYKKEPKWLLRNIEWLRTFYVWLGALAILGGTWAFFLPIAINSGFNKNDDGPVLRQLIIYTTGGLLGAITLGETRRKNDQEHMRQVHAERRSRYAKAIEQLADEKAPIRLGGVYTLAKLVDEWLADEKTLPSEEERHQEGQIIIDSLCAYIRSSFPLAERHDELTLSYEEYQQNRQGNQDLRSSQAIPLPKPKNTKQSREEFIRDKSLFQEEQEVRKKILSEIKNRLNGGKPKNKDDRDEIKPGTWSYFKYDFSNAVFFYDVDFEEVNFSGEIISFFAATFTQQANFPKTQFAEDVNFINTTFKDTVKFSKAKFLKDANFSNFSGLPDYSQKDITLRDDALMAVFEKKADFSEAEFKHKANFSCVKFSSSEEINDKDMETSFSGAIFNKADFSESEFGTKLSTRPTSFAEAVFEKAACFKETKFKENTIFEYSIFKTDANFYGAFFGNDSINFDHTIFEKKTTFSFSKFYYAKFHNVIFVQDTDFSNATFERDSHFNNAIFAKNNNFSRLNFEIFARTLNFHEAIFVYEAGNEFDSKIETAKQNNTIIPKNSLIVESKILEPILNQHLSHPSLVFQKINEYLQEGNYPIQDESNTNP